MSNSSEIYLFLYLYLIMHFFYRERKKKVNGFATLRKKFIRRRRSSKTCDHGRVLRELVSDWTPLEVGALLEEYEALAALKVYFSFIHFIFIYLFI